MIAQLHSPQEAADWLRARVTGSLYADSRSVSQGDGFVAWPGAARDSRQYVNAALGFGVRACLVESRGVDAYKFSGDSIAAYSNLKNDAGPIAAAYFEHPSEKLQTIGITGTNGKTSIAWWLSHALGKLSRKCGLVGTLGIGAPSVITFNGMTTPDPILLQQQLRNFVNAGFAACAIEASSIGIAERRLDGMHFQVAVFTNFTQDHLDYHGSMQNYWAAKQALFDWPGLESAVINIDDPKGLELSLQLKTAGLDVWTVAINMPARLQALVIEQHESGVTLKVVEGHQRAIVKTRAIGLYNVTNLLGVIGAMRALGVTLEDAAMACIDLPAVPGRLNTLAQPGAPLVIIDYAHTPDALEKVLSALQPMARARGGQLWCVFGCGGDRDASKRPVMAAAAQKNADQIVVTSDNPRTENPADIISQVLAGLTLQASIHVQADRALAIYETITRAQHEDVVLLAGKGHEIYQEISGVKYPFDDSAHAKNAMDKRLLGQRS